MKRNQRHQKMTLPDCYGVGHSRKGEMDLSKTERDILVQRIVPVGLKFLTDRGENVFLDCGAGYLRLATCGPFGFIYYTPFSNVPTAPRYYGLEIWATNKQKLFSYWWPPPLLRTFEDGPWCDFLLDYEEYLFERRM